VASGDATSMTVAFQVFCSSCAGMCYHSLHIFLLVIFTCTLQLVAFWCKSKKCSNCERYNV